MHSFLACKMEEEYQFVQKMFFHYRFSQNILLFAALSGLLIIKAAAQSSLCRTSCGDLPIQYPFGIDDGCGSFEYRSLLVCTNDTKLELSTPTGRYIVKNISYVNPHIIISDPSMWSCSAGDDLPHSTSFSLDISRKFSISNFNTFLYFNCNASSVLVKPQPSDCEDQTSRCESVCDSNNYLCKTLPDCPKTLSKVSCCSYYPRTSDSLRLMLQNCESYTSIYWDITNASGNAFYNQIPAYGIRLNYENLSTNHCLSCQYDGYGRGTCGYETEFGNFLCLCSDMNVTTYCSDHGHLHHKTARVIAGTVVGVSVGGLISAGVVIWYFRRIKPNRPVRIGIENSRNGYM